MALTKVTDSIIDFDTLTIAGTQAADTTYLKLQNTPATAATHKVAMEFWGNEGTANDSTFNMGRIYGEFDGSSYSTTRLTLGSASGNGTFNDEINIKNGRVGINSSNPAYQLDVSGSVRSSGGYYIEGNTSGGFLWGIDNYPLRFGTNNTERMRMSSSGDLTIGTSTATSSFYNGANNEVGHGLNGATGYAAHCRAGANTPLYVSHSGTGDGTYIHFYQSTTGRGFISQSGGSTLYNASSDYRLKENVIDLENATSRINSLRPVNFDWIESGENSDGFIAHEAQSIVPYAVEGTHNEVYTEENSLEEQADLLGTPKYQAMDYGKLTPLLVKALQEANAKIEALETRIETLENA